MIIKLGRTGSESSLGPQTHVRILDVQNGQVKLGIDVPKGASVTDCSSLLSDEQQEAAPYATRQHPLCRLVHRFGSLVERVLHGVDQRSVIFVVSAGSLFSEGYFPTQAPVESSVVPAAVYSQSINTPSALEYVVLSGEEIREF
jgi:sRNA-binding carbon storage regulator CsrA